MSLVDDDGVVSVQVAIMGDLGQQHTVGHDRQRSVRGGATSESHLIANLFPQIDPHLLRDAFGDAARGNPARLGVSDASTPQCQADLGKLGGLSRTCLTSDHHDLMVLDEVCDLVGMRRDGKLGVEGDDSPTGQLTFQS